MRFPRPDRLDYCLVAPSYYLSLGPAEILREFHALRRATTLRPLYYYIPVRMLGGKIINIDSLLSTFGRAVFAPYSAANGVCCS